MANLGNTIINGILRVNGDINAGGSIKAPTLIGNLTGNASSATKLQTARRINGVAFDGTKDIIIEAGSSGHTILNSTGTTMTQRSKLKFMNSTVTDDSANDTTIITPSGITGNYLPLSGGTLTTNSYNGLTIKRSDANGSSILYSNSTGALGKIGFTSNGDLVITNGAETDGTANMLKINSDGVAIFFNNTIPSSNNSRTLGTSALKWNNVYATTFTGALSGNATTASTLQTGRTINGTSFNGSANITTANWGTARNIGIVNSDGTGTAVVTSVNGSANINLKLPSTIKATITGNASTASTLANARTINGTSFNGSANITTANWGTARNLTIGNTSKSVNGSANVTWSLSEIGAAPTSHNHSYLPLSGGTLTGNLEITQGNNIVLPSSDNSITYTLGYDNSNFLINYVNKNIKILEYDRITNKLNTSANVIKANSFEGNLNGNASTASSAAKLTTPRTIGLEGDVESVTSKTFDGSANLLIQSRRRGCSVGQLGSTYTNPWYKFADFEISEATKDANIIFNVYASYSDGSTKLGILKAHVRTGGSGEWSSGELKWLVKSSNMNNNDFVLAHNSTSKPTKVELWCKCASGYYGYHFDVISEGSRTERNNAWKLYTTWTAGSAQAPTTGYTQIVSSTLGLDTSITGGATFANQLNAINDRDVKPNVTPKSRVSAYFTSKAGLTGAEDSDWQDLLVMNTWGDTGGQNVNALAFDKSTKAIYHYQASQTATTWGTAHQLAYTTSNVSSASILQTARTINGTSFNGSANITTANWGTARNIGIVNSDGTGTAVPVSVNGSGNVNLKLPATIKASLSGNASTATTATKANQLTTARTIGVSGVTGTAQSFNGTANITIPITAVPASLLTGKNAIKASEINNDKHFIPSSTNTVANIVAMTQSSFNSSGSSLPNNTLVAITDGNDSYVSTQATGITCDLPLDL